MAGAKGVAYKRKRLGETYVGIECVKEYAEIKKRIDEIREAKGIKVSPFKYMEAYAPKKRNLEELIASVDKIPDKGASLWTESERRIDEAFRLYYESGCGMKLSELIEKSGAPASTISFEFEKAGISFSDNPSEFNCFAPKSNGI